MTATDRPFGHAVGTHVSRFRGLLRSGRGVLAVVRTYDINGVYRGPKRSYAALMPRRSRNTGYVRSLSVADVKSIRKRLSEGELGRLDFGGPRPIYPERLESAVARQEAGFDGMRKYEKPHEVAATLFFGVATSHAFENGNKRTALVSFLVSLDQNGFDLVNTTQDELFNMATQVVAHTFPIPSRLRNNPDSEVLALSSWIRSRVTKKSSGERNMDFPDLRKLLQGYGCEIDSPSGNFVTIHRGAASVKTGYPREKFMVPGKEIRRIRGILDLDVVDGGQFYDLDIAVDDFVAEHRDVLDRLADA